MSLFSKIILWYSLFVGIYLMYTGVTIGIRDGDDGILWFTLIAILPMFWSTIKAIRITFKI
ncbi:hypothetical protein M0R04_12510 [Candidatus Dojkabacteria bacterium]|jgi:hypothetical protein|nr:hypothetical protein [Candidatus Dojkabacteria bacterium]